MSEIRLENKSPYDEIITNAHIYNLDESIIASGFPMRTYVDSSSLVTDKDLSRAIKLGKAEPGSGHSNWMSGVLVSLDLTFTVKAWIEWERYHFQQIVSSMSTMHKITSINIHESCDEHVDSRIIDILEEKIKEYNYLNSFPESKNSEFMKEKYLDILMSTPVGLKLTAHVTLNYWQLLTMIKQRHNHRLPEWRTFCQWALEELPYLKEICEGK